MSRGLFYVIAVIAVIATVGGVLALQRRSGDDDSTFGGKDDPVLDAKVRFLRFYDWEASVVGPDGRPAPADPKVTGGAKAGRAGAITRYEAVLRAARRPAKIESDNARTTSIFFAVDRARRQVRGGAASPQEALDGAPAGSKVYEVKPGTAIVAADQPGDRVYVIEDDVAISGSEIREPRQGAESTGRPVTLFKFSHNGLAQFRALTKAIAERGSQAALNAGADNPALHVQHFAVVYLSKILAVPAVDFRRSPDGLDASAGTQLAERLP